jgi:hypothetical protein
MERDAATFKKGTMGPAREMLHISSVCFFSKLIYHNNTLVEEKKKREKKKAHTE